MCGLVDIIIPLLARFGPSRGGCVVIDDDIAEFRLLVILLRTGGAADRADANICAIVFDATAAAAELDVRDTCCGVVELLFVTTDAGAIVAEDAETDGPDEGSNTFDDGAPTTALVVVADGGP
jgi:hypothetical protein